eukprot:scaffold630_cov399-Prasinococcus_capsulatus_cf.AAC.20
MTPPAHGRYLLTAWAAASLLVEGRAIGGRCTPCTRTLYCWRGGGAPPRLRLLRCVLSGHRESCRVSVVRAVAASCPSRRRGAVGAPRSRRSVASGRRRAAAAEAPRRGRSAGSVGGAGDARVADGPARGKERKALRGRRCERRAHPSSGVSAAVASHHPGDASECASLSQAVLARRERVPARFTPQGRLVTPRAAAPRSSARSTRSCARSRRAQQPPGPQPPQLATRHHLVAGPTT